MKGIPEVRKEIWDWLAEGGTKVVNLPAREKHIN